MQEIFDEVDELRCEVRSEYLSFARPCLVFYETNVEIKYRQGVQLL